MKKLVQVVCLSLVTACSFAGEPQCPSVNAIRQMHFDNAFNFGGWMGYSKMLVDKNTWTVEVSAMETEGKSEEEFLDYINQNIKTAKINEPVLVKDKYFQCFYTQEHDSFFVGAVYPSPIPVKMMRR